MKNAVFRWKPLGGLGEVGMNTMLLFFGEECIPVDAGILFADPNDFGIEALHVDYGHVLDKYRPRHWLITHGHEDHVGAVGAILQASVEGGYPCPEIWGPPLAMALARERVAEDRRYPGAAALLNQLKVIPCGGSENLTPDLKVHFLETRHSTLQSCSLAFEWKGGAAPLRVIHTADFKLDASRYVDGVKTVSDIYGVFGAQSPDFVFVDSTNAERSGHSVPEYDLRPAFEKILKNAPGRLFVTLFSSNIQRIADWVQLGAQRGRVTCLAGRSLQSAHRWAQELGFYGTACAEIDRGSVRGLSEVASLPDSEQLILCSGSQGEYRSALMRMAQGTHPDFQLRSEDTVLFSSKLIPGNERPVGRLINALLRTGANILWGEEAMTWGDGPVHASGHARAEEIDVLLRHLKPRHVIPVHGELRQLRACGRVALNTADETGLSAERVHICENGDLLEFAYHSGSWNLNEREKAADPVPRFLRFEQFEAPSRDPFLWARKRVAAQGFVSVSLSASGQVSLKFEGIFPERIHTPEMHKRLEGSCRDWWQRTYRDLFAKDFRSLDPLREQELRDEFSRHVRRVTGMRPYVVLHLVG